jgi:hypothetical protein
LITRASASAARKLRPPCSLWGGEPATITAEKRAGVEDRPHRVAGNIVSLPLAESLHCLGEGKPLRLLREESLQGLAVALACTAAQGFERLGIHQAQDDDLGCPLDTQAIARPERPPGCAGKLQVLMLSPLGLSHLPSVILSTAKDLLGHSPIPHLVFPPVCHLSS